MNIIKLQDILKGVPDDRLQKELQSPTGEIPSYLVLSEVVRRDKLRQSVNATPSQSSVLEDAVAKARSTPMPQQMQGAPQEQPQQETAGYADGGFISPNNAMAQSGVRGFQNMQKPPQQQIQLGASAPSMFSPNLRPKPAPVVSAPVNVTNQGYQPDSYQPDDYQNNSFTQSAMARGGIVALADGDGVSSRPSKAELIAYIREAALKRGMDPDVALKVAYSEGLNADPSEGYQSTIYDDKGNREESYGVFQLNMNPGAVGDQMLKKTGIHPRENVFQGIDFALDTANKVGWSPWMGAAAVGITGKTGTAGNPAGNIPARGIQPSADSSPSGIIDSAVAMLTGQKAATNYGDQGPSAASEGHSPDAVKAMQEDESFLSTIGDMFGGDAVKMGKILMNRQEEKRVPLLDLSTRGDPKAAASTRTRSPAEILEAYQRIRGSYMANGGTVHMQDGPPDGDAVRAPTDENLLTEEEALRYLQLQQFGDILGAGVKDAATAGWRYLGKGANALGVSGLIGAAIGDPNFEFPTSSYLDELYESGGGTPPKPEDIKKLQTQYAVEQTNKQTAAEPIDPRISYRPEGGVTLSGGVPQLPYSPAIDPPPEPGVYDLLREMQTSTASAEQDYYDEMIRMEQEKAKQSGGLGGFLRQMGLGMMATPGSLQQQLIGGLYTAGTSREEAQAAQAGKLNEYKLAKKKADIEAIKNRIQLQVDELTAGQLGPKDKATLAIRALEAKLKDETDPAVRKIIMDQIDLILGDVGVNIPTYLPVDENKVQDTTQGWFQKYVPNPSRPSE